MYTPQQMRFFNGKGFYLRRQKRENGACFRDCGTSSTIESTARRNTIDNQIMQRFWRFCCGCFTVRAHGSLSVFLLLQTKRSGVFVHFQVICWHDKPYSTRTCSCFKMWMQKQKHMPQSIQQMKKTTQIVCFVFHHHQNNCTCFAFSFSKKKRKNYIFFCFLFCELFLRVEKWSMIFFYKIRCSV